MGVLRGGLQGLAKLIPSHVWSHLFGCFRVREGSALGMVMRRASARMPRLLREQNIESDLMTRSPKLARVLPRLALWSKGESLGRQLICPDTSGRLDLLFSTPGNRTLLVVEF